MSFFSELQSDKGARANAIGLAANTGLALAKFVVGTLVGSQALIADGFNSAGDIVATAIAFGGYRIAREPPDENHHFGHGNADTIAGLVIGGILLATGVFVTIEGTRALVEGVTEPPGLLALVVAVGTAVVKEGLYRYTTAVGREVRSPALLASARDHRADVFIAITVFAGIFGARLGMPWLDPAAACVIGVYIAYMAWEPIRENFGVLMDEAPEGARERIFDIARSDPEVREAGEIRVHPLGGEWVVDLVIYVDGSRTLHDAHAVARRVQALIQDQVVEVCDVRAHVKPTGSAR